MLILISLILDLSYIGSASRHYRQPSSKELYKEPPYDEYIPSTTHFNGVDGTTEGRGVDAVEVSSRRDVFVVRIFDKYSAALLPRSFCGSRVSSSLTVTSASLRSYAFRLSSSVFSTYKMSPFPSNRSATTAHSDRLNGDSELSGEYAQQWSQALFSSSQRKTPHKVHNVPCGLSETSSGESSSSSKVISRASSNVLSLPPVRRLFFRRHSPTAGTHWVSNFLGSGRCATLPSASELFAGIKEKEKKKKERRR